LAYGHAAVRKSYKSRKTFIKSYYTIKINNSIRGQKMRRTLKTNIDVDKDFSLVPISEKIREKHFAEILDVLSLKDLTLTQRKKEASKPIYLVRYE